MFFFPREKTQIREFSHLFFWFVVGSCLILIPLIVIMTKSSIDRQERLMEKLLLEKGEALIRSYEAGSRAAAARRFGPFEQQKLVTELAHQPGVDYIIITDQNGLVIADSEPFRIGGFYAIELKLENLLSLTHPSSRRVKNVRGADTFEVYRPLGTKINERGHLYMFVGLDMGPMQEAHQENIKRAIILSLVLLIVGFMGIFALFLTYRYRTTRSSLEQLRLFSRYLLEHLPVGVVSLSREGKITLINDAAVHLLEEPSEKAEGAQGEKILPSAVSEAVEDLRKKRHLHGREVEWKRKDGKTTTAEIMVAGLEDGGTIVLLRDLGEVKKLREEVERSRTLAAIGSLAAGIAHEIRNPLSSIKGFATYFLETYASNQEAREAAEVMIAEIERLNRVITQLLSLARPPILRCTSVEIGEIIDQSIKAVAPEFTRKGVQIKNNVHGKKCFCDPDQMKQVFLNLFLNALAATDQGGQVTVEGKDLSNGHLSITVSDTGRGIKAEDLPYVFDPFFTTKPTGTGLGLAVVQKIMEAHGGEVSITSTPGRGTAVHLTLTREDKTL